MKAGWTALYQRLVLSSSLSLLLHIVLVNMLICNSSMCVLLKLQP